MRFPVDEDAGPGIAPGMAPGPCLESLHDDLAIDRIREARVIKAEYGATLVENTAVSTQQLRVSALLRQHFDATFASREDQVQLLQLIGHIGVAAEDPVLTTRLGDVVPKDPRTVSKWAEGDPYATLPSDAPVFTVTFNIKSLGLLQSTATLTRCDLTMVLQQMLLDERFVPYMTFCSSHKRMPLPGETGPEFCDSKLCWDLQQTVTPGVPILWVALWADGAETGRLGSMHPVVLDLFNTPFALRHEKGAVPWCLTCAMVKVSVRLAWRSTGSRTTLFTRRNPITTRLSLLVPLMKQ